MLDHSWECCDNAANRSALPATLEAGADALVRGALRGLADRARDGDAVEQLLLGADLAQPFVVGARQALAGDQAGAGVVDAQFRGLIGLIVALRTGGGARHRHY